MVHWFWIIPLIPLLALVSKLSSLVPFLINSNFVLSFLVLKQYNLDKEDLSNIPIFYLSFLSKLTERVVKTAVLRISLQ